MGDPPTRTRHTRRLAAGVAVVATALAGPTTAARARQEARVEVQPVPTPVTWIAEPPVDWPSPPPASAQAYLLVDAGTGQVLAARDPDEPRIVASTVKLLTILTALETLSPEDTIVVGDEAAVGGAGTSVDPGETWRVADLLDAVLVRSGNDAARALAQAAGDGDIDAFVDQMRATADDLGLDDAVIVDPTGLDDANELSARDLAVLARTALADERIRASAGKDVVALPGLGGQENRNLLIGTYAGATGLKTGFTELAGYCLVASAERDGRELVAVVLGAREDPARFEEAAGLLDLGFDGLADRPWDALRARRPGGWDELLPAGRVWAPVDADPAVELRGTSDALEIRVIADEHVLGTGAVDVPSVAASGVGDRLAEVLYREMRAAHLAGLWPGDGGADTTGGDSG